jgi:hypothetical protein
MVNNGTVNYDHDRDGTHSQMEGCSVRNLDALELFLCLIFSPVYKATTV